MGLQPAFVTTWLLLCIALTKISYPLLDLMHALFFGRVSWQAMWVAISPHAHGFAGNVPDILFDVMDYAVCFPADHVACAAFPLGTHLQQKGLLAFMWELGVAAGPRLGYVVGHVTYGAPGVALFGKPIGPAAHVGLMDVVFQLLQAELLEALITAVAICQCVG